MTAPSGLANLSILLFVACADRVNSCTSAAKLQTNGHKVSKNDLHDSQA